MDIQKCSVSDILSEVALIEEYANESAVLGLPQPKGKLGVYQQLENSGAIACFSAQLEGKMIGFITVLASVLPHYGDIVPVTESFFVARGYRTTGAGLKLLAVAERYVDDLNLPGPLVSAPMGSGLAEVLSQKKSYEEVGRVFFRKKVNA